MKSLTARYRGSYFSYILVYFFYYFSMAAFSSVLSVYLTGIGKSPQEMTFIVSASGIFSFAVVPALGYLSDRTGKPKAISCCLLAAVGVLSAVFAFCREVWALFLLNGFIMSFVNSLSNVCERMAGASPFRYGSIRIWGTFGYAAGAQIAGLILEWFPPSFLFFTLPVSALFAILGFFGTGDVQPQTAPEEKQEGKLSVLLRNPRFLFYLVIALCSAGCNALNMTYAPVLITSLGVLPGAMGTVLFFSTLTEIPLILLSHRFMDRFSGKTLLMAGFVLSVIQFLTYGFSRSAWVTVAMMVLIKAVTSTLFMMIILKIVRNLIGPRYTTTGLSVVHSVTNLGNIAMQNLSGFLVGSTNVHVLYLALAGLSVLGLLLTLFLKVPNTEKVFS